MHKIQKSFCKKRTKYDFAVIFGEKNAQKYIFFLIVLEIFTQIIYNYVR